MCWALCSCFVYIISLKLTCDLARQVGDISLSQLWKGELTEIRKLAHGLSASKTRALSHGGSERAERS